LCGASELSVKNIGARNQKVGHPCPSVYFYQLFRELIAQKLDDNRIHVLYARKFLEGLFRKSVS